MSPPLTRRRFLAISAASLAGPGRAAPVEWCGIAMGADIRLSLHAPVPEARRAIAVTRTLLRRVEALFSLHDPGSVLSALNRDGQLAAPPADFARLLRLCDRMHRATGGRFDPTVQPLWKALAQGREAEAAVAAGLVGWQRLRIDGAIRLAPGQALTLNGIAQGHATDLVRGALKGMGLGRVLVDMGEIAALGGPFRLGLADPGRGVFATRNLRDRALATSSPGALALGAEAHILDPARMRRPLWSSVSVEADSAAVADAASTAFTLMTAAEIAESLARLPAGTRAVLLGPGGALHEIG